MALTSKASDQFEIIIIDCETHDYTLFGYPGDSATDESNYVSKDVSKVSQCLVVESVLNFCLIVVLMRERSEYRLQLITMMCNLESSAAMFGEESLLI